MRTDFIPFEPTWITPISTRLKIKMEDRGISTEQLAYASGIAVDTLMLYLGGAGNDLSDSDYHSIEQALDLPQNYFLKMKMMYAERMEKLKTKQTSNSR